MQVHCDEGVAIRIGPESCAGVREGAGEALTGEIGLPPPQAIPQEGELNKSPLGTSETGDPLLLTPGHLTTSKAVKGVMTHDRGSRDAAFLEINATVLYRLPEIITFYDKLKDRGYVIYPGSFRIRLHRPHHARPHAGIPGGNRGGARGNEGRSAQVRGLRDGGRKP